MQTIMIQVPKVSNGKPNDCLIRWNFQFQTNDNQNAEDYEFKLLDRMVFIDDHQFHESDYL